MGEWGGDEGWGWGAAVVCSADGQGVYQGNVADQRNVADLIELVVSEIWS